MKKSRQFLLATVLLLLVSLIGGGAIQPSSARAASKPPTKGHPSPFSSVAPAVYAHSWYVGNPDIPHNYTAMYNLGASDGRYDSVHCTLSQVMLDFGQVDYGSGYWGGGSGYGTYIFNSSLHYPFITDAQVLASAENYVQGYYNASSSCPRLRIILGVSNFRECLNSPCTTYNAGTAWGQTVQSLHNYVSSKGESWKIVDVAGGDDIETDVSHGWDTYSTTIGFVEGFNHGDSTALLMDDGDVFANSYWTDAELYTVNWGYGNDVPIPEIYGQGLLNSYIQFYRNHPDVYFYGVLTECANIQPNMCYSPYGEYTPSIAFNALVNGVGSSHVGAFATNILYQV
ncbi:MAG TPA: hypothetical protein VKU38_09880 [Ktedonobacteraceae bacterium]|nr:hypothetical protein [Ktedonobacteraceae bacterium]